MTFKFRPQLLGGHIHIAVFSGKDRDHLGKCGDLVMRQEEWDVFQGLLCVFDHEASMVDHRGHDIIFENQA